MKQKKRYEDALRDELVNLGLYNERNERLIKNHALNDWLIAEMEESLRRQSLELRQVGSQGQTKITMHPFVERISILNAKNAFIEVHLGMGNKDTIEIEKETELEAFLREIEL